MTWHAVHIFDYVDYEALTLEVIGPLAARVNERAHRCFFIRYWEGGPHIRFRVEVPDDETAAGYLDEVRERAMAYFARQPESPRLDEAIKQARANYAGRDERMAAGLALDLVPHRTIRSEPYEPEYEKYGGSRGVTIAEQLFCASTSVVLDVLPAVAHDRLRSRRRLHGLVMMLGALRAAGFGGRVATKVLDDYWRYWSRYVSERTWTRWSDGARADRNGLADEALSVLCAPTLPDHLVTWEGAVGDAFAALRQDVSPDPRRLADLVRHYLHTHNNRMGIVPVEEAYLAQLGLRAIDSLLE